MDYNKEYIDIKVSLINSILANVPTEILDVSYSVSGNQIQIQFVLLNGAHVSENLRKGIQNNLKNYEVVIKTLHSSKEDFNKNKGNWNPVGYQWLDYVLYSKSETL